MASTVDEITCPKCGYEYAVREQKTNGSVKHFCSRCKWKGEDIEDEDKVILAYSKIVPGFVTQQFEKRGKKFVCVAQDFSASEEVTREDAWYDNMEIDDTDIVEVEFPMEMEQPK